MNNLTNDIKLIIFDRFWLNLIDFLGNMIM